MNEKSKQILKIVKKYGFNFLEEDPELNELRIEYTADDLDYRDENDFSSRQAYQEFANEQGEVVTKKFMEAYLELNLKQIIISDFYFDAYDYPVVLINL